MKKFLKITGLILGILILLLGSVLLYLRYEFRYKRTEIIKSTAESETAGEEVAKEVSQESKDYYMTLEPACSFQTEGGMEYRMVAVDRALGSSFYVLIGVEDHGKTCISLMKV